MAIKRGDRREMRGEGGNVKARGNVGWCGGGVGGGMQANTHDDFV